jgi:hypothetical protein
MILTIENLGVVKRIDLDLSKPLIVFCGPNCTGKTYVSYVVHGWISTDDLLQVNIFKMEDLRLKGTLDIPLEPTMFDYGLNMLSRVIQLRTPSLFGLSALNKDLFTNLRISTTIENVAELSLPSIKTNDALFSKEKNGNLHIELTSALVESSFDDFQEMAYNDFIGRFLCNGPSRSHFLPVERHAVYTFANNIAANQMRRVNGDKDDMARYPLTIRESLSTAVDLTHVNTLQSRYAWLADEIEQDILKGKISISDDGAIQFCPDAAKEVQLPINLSASLIKNLSALLIYLRHQAHEYDLLIIDEPELGLHPDNQIKLARIFGKMLNAGIHLLINTHSNYIIRELNNLIMLSDANVDEEMIKEYGYRKKDMAIKPEDVGAYLFDVDKEEPDKVTATLLDVDKYGFDVETIGRAIDDLNKNSDELFYLLKYGKDE